MVNNYTLMEEVLSQPGKIQQYAKHPDWRVRYATAVAIGETKDEKWIDTLLEMMKYEDTRSLYTQPPVIGFENSYDDTRMAEQLVPIKEIFDQNYPEELREDWRCRGRVKHCSPSKRLGRSPMKCLHICIPFCRSPGRIIPYVRQLPVRWGL